MKLYAQNSFWKQIIFTVTVFFFVINISKAQCPDHDVCYVLPTCESKINITIGGYWKVITSNGIPNHTIGIFPYFPDGKGCGRPTALKEQAYTYIIPAYSATNEKSASTIFNIPTPPFDGEPETAFGVAVNGVPFDPAAAEWWNPSTKTRVREETPWRINPLRNDLMQFELDCNYGHVQPDGGYHYHGYPYHLVDSIRAQTGNTIVLLGWAFDGNPIYGEQCGKSNVKKDIVDAKSSYKMRTSRTALGSPPSGPYDLTTGTFPMGDFLEDFYYDNSEYVKAPGTQLDQCNGHFGLTPEFPNGVYHYHILEKTDLLSDIGFPYIGRCYRLFNYKEGPNIFPK